MEPCRRTQHLCREILSFRWHRQEITQVEVVQADLAVADRAEAVGAVGESLFLRWSAVQLFGLVVLVGAQW